MTFVFCVMKWEMRNQVPEVRGLNYVAGFADNGADGGGCEEGYKASEKEMALGPQYCLMKQLRQDGGVSLDGKEI